MTDSSDGVHIWVDDIVSVVIPVYNSERYVGETLESVLSQSYDQLEVLVVDDASSDNTRAIIQSVGARDSRITLVASAKNLGAARARNLGIERARGRFVAFCDADDIWLPNKLEAQLKFIHQKSAPLSFTAYEIIDAEGHPTGTVVDYDNRDSVDYEDMLRKRATMGCSTVIVDRKRVGSFVMPDLRTGQDYATWLRLLRRGFRAHCLNQILTCYRITPGSISRNKRRKAIRQWEIYRDVEDLSLGKALECFGHYVIRALVRR